MIRLTSGAASRAARTRVLGSLVLFACAATATSGYGQVGLKEELRIGTWVEEDARFLSVSGQPAPGFERELLEGFAALHRVGVRIVPLETIEGVIEAVEKGEVDVMAGGFVASAARRERLDFASGIFPTRHVVMTREPRPVLETIEQLRRQSVGTVTETSWAEAVAAAGVAPEQVRSYGDQASLMEGFRSGDVSAVVMSLETAVEERRADPRIRLGLFVDKGDVIGWGVMKGNHVLLEALGDYVANVRRSGTWNRLVIKYWGVDALEILKKAQAE